MKRFLSCVVSAAFVFTAFTTFASCGEDKDSAPLTVTVDVPATDTTPCGTTYTVKDPLVKGVDDYTVEVAVTAAEGGAVNYNEEKKSFYAKNLGADAYTITYTVSYEDLGKTASTKGVTRLSTTDGEKPTISAPDYVTGVKGGKVEVPAAVVKDNSGEAITATHVVRDEKGATVETLKEDGKEYVQISAEAKYYTVTYNAVDSSGNAAAEHECKIWIRSSLNEVEFFDTKDLVDVTAENSRATVVAATDAPEGGTGNVLKVEVPAKNDTNPGYVSLTLRNLGVTDFTNVTKLKMKVYSTLGLSNYPDWHAGNSIVPGKLDGGTAGKGVTAQTWTELVWTRAQVQEMFNGQTAGNPSYSRCDIDNVTELRFDIDNCGYWSTLSEAEGGNVKWESQAFTLYIDAIEVTQMDLNWTPRSYETDTATVYEINTFNDEARLEMVSSMRCDPDKFKISLSDEYSVPFDPDHPEEDNMSLKVELTSCEEAYPRFVCSLEKLAKVLNLGELPDNALFKISVYYASASGGMKEQTGSGDQVRLIGGDNLVFYETGNPTEKKAPIEYMWYNIGTKIDISTTVAQMKETSIDVGKLSTGGFYFSAGTGWEGDFGMVVYFDNFRIEVPKA